MEVISRRVRTPELSELTTGCGGSHPSVSFTSKCGLPPHLEKSRRAAGVNPPGGGSKFRAPWLPALVGSKNFVSDFILERDDGRKRRRYAALKLPPVVLHLRQAEEFQRLLETGEVRSRTEIARRHGLTKARVTQILDLLLLPHELLDFVRGLPPGTPERQVTERKLRTLARAPKRALDAAERGVPGFRAWRRERAA